jgi:hydroxysqualene synthase
MTTHEAYAYCRKVATEHYENFPVVSVLVPRAMRDHLFAIYAFARVADDIADEGSAESSDRVAALLALGHGLRQGVDDDPVMVAVRATIQSCNLPLELFDRLLTAFERDADFQAPESWDDVKEYCHYSANPVGELFLRLAYGTQVPPVEAIAASNDICTALQITNFLQDIGVDLERGRNYIPLSDDETIERTTYLYATGSSVIRFIPSWRLKAELWAIIHGGKTMLYLCSQRTSRTYRPTLTPFSLLAQLFRRR